MANYKNSLGESELFERMTAGFAKVCESVQSGKFVRDEMGVVCESVCEDEDDIERDSMFGDDDVFIGRNDEYYNEDPDNEPVFTPAYWTYSMDGADDECFAKEGPVFKLTDEGKRDFEEWWDAEQVGTDLCYGRFKDEKFGKKHLSREQEWEYLTDPKNGLSVEVTGKVEEDDVVTDAGTEGATQDADVASETPKQINGSTENVNEGAGAGYTITIENLELEGITELTKVDDGYDFTVKIVPGDYDVTAYSYYDRYFPLDDFDEPSIKIDGGEIYGNLTYIPSEVDTDEIRDYVEHEVCSKLITISTMYSGGRIRQYLPENGDISLNHVSIKNDDVYFTIYNVFIDSKNMSEKINYGYVHCNDEDDVKESCGQNKKPRKLLKEGAIGSTLGTIGGSIIGGAVGHPIIGGAVGGALGNRIGDAIHDKWHGNMGPYRKQSLKRDLAAGIGGAVGGFVGNLSPTLNGMCASLGSNLGSSVAGKAVGAAAGAVAPTAAGAIAGKAVGNKILKTNESCVGKKPLKKLIPEGCCGGKAKKVLKECGSEVVTEKKVPLCKTCGNPLDETGTCQDCQGYSEVKECESEIKLQVPADIRRRALLKNGAKDNQRKLACAIRDRKATGIIKEDANGKNEDPVVANARRIFGYVDKMRAGIRKGHDAHAICDIYLSRIENMTASLLSSYANMKK